MADDSLRRVRESIAEAERRLAAIPGQPRQDAELLMAGALRVSLSDLLLRHMDERAPAAFEPLLARRLAREPIAYITGRAGFWTIELAVGPGVLIPRADSETLIEAAVQHFGARAPATILDLGTGPGTLLLAALDEWPGARGVGVDASADALAYARANAGRLGLADRATFAKSDWADAVDGAFDLVLANPPYVAGGAALPGDVADWEPPAALFAGPDGLAAYRRIVPVLDRLVAPGGLACLELGEGQDAAVRALFDGLPFTLSSRSDLRGVARCLAASR